MFPTSTIPLSQLSQRERGWIVEICNNGALSPSSADYGITVPLHDRLLDLGFEEGALVEGRHQGPFGGPLAVQVEDRLIAIRPADADEILVRPERAG